MIHRVPREGIVDLYKQTRRWEVAADHVWDLEGSIAAAEVDDSGALDALITIIDFSLLLLLLLVMVVVIVVVVLVLVAIITVFLIG